MMIFIIMIIHHMKRSDNHNTRGIYSLKYMMIIESRIVYKRQK